MLFNSLIHKTICLVVLKPTQLWKQFRVLINILQHCLCTINVIYFLPDFSHSKQMFFPNLQGEFQQLTTDTRDEVPMVMAVTYFCGHRGMPVCTTRSPCTGQRIATTWCSCLTYSRVQLTGPENVESS